MNKFYIAVYVDNHFGVLTRVTSMFTRRGFNIDALTVGETENPDYSRVTICMSGDGYAKAQLLNQLRKLHNVKRVEVINPENSIQREMMLLKIKNNPLQRQDVMAIINTFRAKIVDFTNDALCIECTGNPSKMDAFIEVMRAYDIIELCRTGIVAIERGASSLFTNQDNY